jgi:regulator of protease activity HflC (stomatin/prohibitin superfamily)
MKGLSISAIVVIAALIAFYLFNAAYTVSEVEQVIITQFGKPVGEPITPMKCPPRTKLILWWTTLVVGE